jgi:hypothetical protein
MLRHTIRINLAEAETGARRGIAGEAVALLGGETLGESGEVLPGREESESIRIMGVCDGYGGSVEVLVEVVAIAGVGVPQLFKARVNLLPTLTRGGAEPKG